MGSFPQISVSVGNMVTRLVLLFAVISLSTGATIERGSRFLGDVINPRTLEETTTAELHKTYINMDSSNWQQGGVTTVVTPSAAPPPSFELLQPTGSSQEDQELGSPSTGAHLVSL